MTVTTDRIEGDIAVLEREDGTFFNVPLSVLPQGIKEGSCIDITDGVYSLNDDLSAERRKRIFEKQQKLFDKKS